MKIAKSFWRLNSVILPLIIIAFFVMTISITTAADDAKDYWVLLSDIHIPGEYDKAQNGFQPNHQFAQIRDEILTGETKPFGVVITGDIAFLQGEADDYRTLAKQLDPLSEAGITVYPLLGNHDDYENFS